MIKRITGFKTYIEAKEHSEKIKDCVKNVLGFGYSIEEQHFFEVEEVQK